ncbi:UNVERIFIED_CONTAM: hypothetical protein GTU68_048192 [Idotea baltica]|nr:hypothetical protein [Idotea baltica]
MSKTLFDKVWDSHVVRSLDDGPDVLFIDRHLVHEVTSPVAFQGIKQRGNSVLFPAKTFATADHNTPTINQHLPVDDPLSANQLKALEENANAYGISHWGLGHEKNGIVHVVGPEYGITQPGATIVCGDSHTSTHGAFGAIAFGIGTSEVEMVLATEFNFDAADIEPMITYGTNPGMGIGISKNIPNASEISGGASTYQKSLGYMDFNEGEEMIGKPVDYVFIGSCTNGRIEDFRAFASIVKGRKKADNVIAWLVPGSHKVEKAIHEEGILQILEDAGFELREPGCSACLAMNDDKVPAGKYAVSTSNRNFEGRQGPGSRTLLASPYSAAAAAVTGKVTDPRDLLTIKN